MMKNVQKSSRYLTFFVSFWLCRTNGLISLIAMMSKRGQQNIVSNISRSKGNQTMKLDHVIEDNKRNIFLQKS